MFCTGGHGKQFPPAIDIFGFQIPSFLSQELGIKTFELHDLSQVIGLIQIPTLCPAKEPALEVLDNDSLGVVPEPTGKNLLPGMAT